MTTKFLDGYVDVPTRLRMALEKYPDLRVVECPYQTVEFAGGQIFLVFSVAVYLTPDDPRPVTGSAWEPFPGKSPYTRDSEWMVGHTSALGRALGYLGFGIDKAIASQNEVDARREPTERPERPLERPERAPLGSQAQTDPTGPTKAQLGKLRALGYTGPTPNTKLDASREIDKLVAAKTAIATGEDPF
jgi:hypothetical protein